MARWGVQAELGGIARGTPLYFSKINGTPIWDFIIYIDVLINLM